MIRIANGQGFWGDSIDAPVQLVEYGEIDYLTLDYLAEVTLSIMQRQKLKNPQAGYARDFISLIERILPDIIEKNIRCSSFDPLTHHSIIQRHRLLGNKIQEITAFLIHT